MRALLRAWPVVASSAQLSRSSLRSSGLAGTRRPSRKPHRQRPPHRPHRPSRRHSSLLIQPRRLARSLPWRPTGACQPAPPLLPYYHRRWVASGGSNAGTRPGRLLSRAIDQQSSSCTCRKLQATRSRKRFRLRSTAVSTTRHVPRSCSLQAASPEEKDAPWIRLTAKTFTAATIRWSTGIMAVVASSQHFESRLPL